LTTPALTNFDHLWDYQNPAATESKFRALLPAAETSADISYLLQLQTQIARTQGLQAHFEECHVTLDRIEEELQKHDLKIVRIRYLLERGRAFNSQGHPDRAKSLFIQAADLAAASSHFNYAIDAAHMVAIVDPDPDAQITWALRALEWIDQHPEQNRWLFTLNNNLGETYRVKEDYENGLACFRRCDHLRPNIFSKKDIAKMLRLLNRADEALATIEPIAIDLKDTNKPDGYIAAEYAECLLATNQPAKAKPQFIEAFRLLEHDSYMLRYEPNELQRYSELVRRLS